MKKTILDQMVAEGKKEQLKSFEQVRVNVCSPIDRVMERYRHEFVFILMQQKRYVLMSGIC